MCAADADVLSRTYICPHLPFRAFPVGLDPRLRHHPAARRDLSSDEDSGGHSGSDSDGDGDTDSSAGVAAAAPCWLRLARRLRPPHVLLSILSVLFAGETLVRFAFVCLHEPHGTNDCSVSFFVVLCNVDFNLSSLLWPFFLFFLCWLLCLLVWPRGLIV